ncbi:hypothetical protein Q31b_44870 [Novipirellula aureliae]|uniref:Uncharacterized protein n=1 Tax=Novipirellula aureliae TaxID=2527966 RepID=A0A5C6DLN8_9BACT|nr:hypothetical protein [Novipirellula aureliae]TWU37698.1 hypothetical protein Q31b_44870 [Novipirellula aureliae]
MTIKTRKEYSESDGIVPSALETNVQDRRSLFDPAFFLWLESHRGDGRKTMLLEAIAAADRSTGGERSHTLPDRDIEREDLD